MTSTGSSRKAESRLLDSAVRDAVGPSGTSGKSASRKRESGNKRLRSVVVADNADELPGDSGRQYPAKPRLDMGAKLLPGVAVALKAAAAAAEDVKKPKTARARSSGSVWDRLGMKCHDELHVTETEAPEQDEMETDNGVVEDAWENNGVIGESDGKNGKRQRSRKLSERLGKVNYDEGFDVARGNDLGTIGIGGLQNARTSGGELGWRDSRNGRVNQYAEVVEGEHYDHTLGRSVGGFVRYGVGKDLHDRLSQRPVSELTGMEDALGRQDDLGSDIPGAVEPVHIMQNIHINSNIRFLQPDEDRLYNNASHAMFSLPSTRGMPGEKEMDPSFTSMDPEDLSEMRKRMRQVELEMTKLRAKQVEVSREVQKASTTTSAVVPKPRTKEEIQAHSVCVMNIHFAATKETIAAHFSNCGEIALVTIFNDSATGKPKGSAYVEFASKDGFEKALGLNESSLLSRTLKIVQLDDTIESAFSTPTFQPVSHKPPFVPVRPPGKYSRGTPVNLRRLASFPRPIPGTAHLQWKRDSGSAGKLGFSPISGPSLISPLQRVPAYPTTSAMRDRSGLGPIRMNRSMSYVRPVPYTPRETSQAFKEQKVAN